MITQQYINDTAYKIVGCAIEVHKQLGPGLLESVYHSCMIEELTSVSLNVKSQIYIPVKYKDKDLGGMLKFPLTETTKGKLTTKLPAQCGDGAM